MNHKAVTYSYSSKARNGERVLCYIKYKTKGDAGSPNENVYTSVYMIYIDIASKFSFHPRYRIFPGQPFSPSRSFLYYPFTSSTLLFRSPSPPRATLYTKQSNLEPVARTTAPTCDC